MKNQHNKSFYDQVTRYFCLLKCSCQIRRLWRLRNMTDDRSEKTEKHKSSPLIILSVFGDVIKTPQNWSEALFKIFGPVCILKNEVHRISMSTVSSLGAWKELRKDVHPCLKRRSRFYKNKIARKGVFACCKKRCNCEVLKINLKRSARRKEVRKTDFGSEGNASRIVCYAKA